MSAAQPFPPSKYALSPQRKSRANLPSRDMTAVVPPDGVTLSIAPRRPHYGPRAAEVDRQQLRLKSKVDQAAKLLDMLELRQYRLTTEIKKLQARKTRAAERIERIEQRAIAEMQQAGFDSAPGMWREVRLKACPPAVEIENVRLLPAEYLRITETTAPDKIAIKNALLRNEEIPGAKLTSKLSLERK